MYECCNIFQPEPFFISFALYDARYGCKISEDFHFDPNSDDIRGLLPSKWLFYVWIFVNAVESPIPATVKRLIFGEDLSWWIWLGPKNRQIK